MFLIFKEMLQEAWHYRQTNFTTYQASDTSIEFNTELVPWTGKIYVYGSLAWMLAQSALKKPSLNC